MDKIITDFGIQPIYLAAQIVNFTIFVFILKKFLYKPILKVLDERRKTVEQNILNAKKIEQALEESERQSEEKIAKAHDYAQTIIKKASTTADQIIADAHEQVEADVEAMIKKGKLTLSLEREAIKKELRQELADLVILGLERVASQTLQESDQRKLLQKTLKDLEDSTA